MKRNFMAQWMNLHQNNSFVNQTQLPLLCEKSPSASGSYGRPAGSQINTGRFEKFSTDHIGRIFAAFNTKVQCYYSVTNAFQLVFSGKM